MNATNVPQAKTAARGTIVLWNRSMEDSRRAVPEVYYAAFEPVQNALRFRDPLGDRRTPIYIYLRCPYAGTTRPSQFWASEASSGEIFNVFSGGVRIELGISS